MSFQDSTKDTETKQYLAYPDLSKKLELKWYSNNEERICPKRAHNTNTSFDLQYPGQSLIIIASHSLIKIDFKIVLEISVSTMNNLDRPYKIESQEKIAQVIFLPLVKIPQLTLEDSDQVEFINTDTVISIPSYQQYILKVNQKIQDQALLFEASPEICSLADVANLYLLAKAYKHFKILIYNPTEDVIEISKGTLVGSISTDIQNPEKPQSIPDFAQLFLFYNITSQVWNLPKKSYLFTPEEINKLNVRNLSTLQQIQLKVFLNQYANVFASENEFGCTNIVKHQIDTEDARPIKQRAYCILLSGNNLIKQEVQ
ncbi:hypothetical protein G9A89_020368 [Geosiphon pyriformis]|nr:hypothetical protein G9A89_020368 [Geosiphon pyriformis]